MAGDTPTAGWSLMSWMEGSRPCFALNAYSQFLISVRRAAMSMQGYIEEQGYLCSCVGQLRGFVYALLWPVPVRGCESGRVELQVEAELKPELGARDATWGVRGRQRPGGRWCEAGARLCGGVTLTPSQSESQSPCLAPSKHLSLIAHDGDDGLSSSPLRPWAEPPSSSPSPPPQLLPSPSFRSSISPVSLQLSLYISSAFPSRSTMNANSLNSYPATLVQGLLSPASQGAAHDDPLQPSISSRSRPASLFIPHAPNSRSTRPTSYPYPPTQQQSSTASSSYVSAATMASYSRPLPPQAFLDDPAFSSDPDENPHFSMSSLGDFLPVNSAALDVVRLFSCPLIFRIKVEFAHIFFDFSPASQHASMRDNMYSPESAPIRDRSSLPPQHLRAHSAAYDPQFPPSVSPHHPRTRSHASALPPPRAPPSHDTWAFRPFDDPLDDFPYSEQALAPASRSFQDAKSRSHSESRSQPHYQPNVSPTSSASSSPITPPLSLESAPSSFSHSSYSHTSYSQSNYSHSSHSHSSHSDASHGSSKAAKMSTKKAPPAEPIVLLPPPAYSALPPPSDRPFPVTAVSAPEIRQASAATADVPPRSTSVPAPKAPAPPNPIARPSELRKQRSRRQSAAPPPGGLDKIDELDETDPLGFAWHHDSRYEGVKKLNEEADLKEEKDAATLLVCTRPSLCDFVNSYYSYRRKGNRRRKIALSARR